MPVNPFAAAAPQEPDVIDQMCGLSRTQRMYGFGICFVVGVVVCFLSTMLLSSGNIIGFGVVYTLGNVVALMATSFLVGPATQIKSAFNKTRVTATLIYLGAMAGTLCSAILLHSVILTIVFSVVQFVALLWYSLSYIPYARTLVRKMFGMGSSSGSLV